MRRRDFFARALGGLAAAACAVVGLKTRSVSAEPSSELLPAATRKWSEQRLEMTVMTIARTPFQFHFSAVESPPEMVFRTPGINASPSSMPAGMNYMEQARELVRLRRRDPESWNKFPFPVQYQALGDDASPPSPVLQLESDFGVPRLQLAYKQWEMGLELQEYNARVIEGLIRSCGIPANLARGANCS